MSALILPIVRAALCARLREVQSRLSAAPLETHDAAQRRPDHRLAHQAGALEQICRNEAAVLGDLIRILEVVS